MASDEFQFHLLDMFSDQPFSALEGVAGVGAPYHERVIHPA